MKRSGMAVLLGALIYAFTPQRGAAEWFVEAYLGKSFTHDTDLKINQPANATGYTVHDLSFDDESFRSPFYYGTRAGHFFRRIPWLGVSFDFFHFKMMADTGESKHFTGMHNGAPINTVQPVDTLIQNFNISHGVNYLTLNAILRKGFFTDGERFPNGRLQAYVGVGPGLVIAHPENQVEGVGNHQQYELAGVGVHTFAGVKWLLFKYLGVFGEYKFTHSHLKVDLGVGDAKLGETSHHTVLGITVPFLL
jgi:hypothetical protein